MVPAEAPGTRSSGLARHHNLRQSTISFPEAFGHELFRTVWPAVRNFGAAESRDLDLGAPEALPVLSQAKGLDRPAGRRCASGAAWPPAPPTRRSHRQSLHDQPPHLASGMISNGMGAAAGWQPELWRGPAGSTAYAAALAAARAPTSNAQSAIVTGNQQSTIGDKSLTPPSPRSERERAPWADITCRSR